MGKSYIDLLEAFGIGGAHPGGLWLTKQLLKNVSPASSVNILDAGCGTGQTTEFIISQYKCRVTAIDYHPGMVKKARNRLRKHSGMAHVLHGNIEQLPLKDDSFDYVLSESVLSFVDIQKALKEFTRVLVPGGSLLAVEMAKESVSPDEEKRFADFYGISALLSEREWMDEFSSAGFAKTEVISFDLPYDEGDDDFWETSSEFNPSARVSKDLVKMLHTHEQMTEEYFGKVGYRVFKCTL